MGNWVSKGSTRRLPTQLTDEVKVGAVKQQHAAQSKIRHEVLKHKEYVDKMAISQGKLLPLFPS